MPQGVILLKNLVIHLQHHDAQYDYTQHKGLLCDIQNNDSPHNTVPLC